jgi:hypothetical protein
MDSPVLRGANWRKQARTLYVALTAFLVIPHAIASGLDVHGLPATVAVLGGLYLLCDWRVRKMGLRITDDGLEAIRFVDTVRVRWDEIAGFFTRPAGFGLWGDFTIRVHRKALLGKRIPRGVGMALPTVMIIGQTNPIGRWIGPCDLVGPNQRVAQADIVHYLTTALRDHQTA